jgi:hypothetical protein
MSTGDSSMQGLVPRRAVSVRQPWATLIIEGRKTIELRTWVTEYRGRIWLHAASAVNETLDAHFGIAHPPRGAFLGLVDLVTTVSVDRERWTEWRDMHLDPGEYSPGYHAWILRDPVPLVAPISARGRPGLYSIDHGLAGDMFEQLRNRSQQE